MERRQFIAVVGGATVGILLPYSLYRYMSDGLRLGRVGVSSYLDAGPQAALRAITPTADFYVTTAGATPYVDETKWSLGIDGLVERPLKFSYDEVRTLPLFDTTLTLECISNPLGGKFIGNATWRGTLLKPLIEQARPLSEAAYVVFYATDGFSSGHPIERVLRDDNFLAWEMNGEPLNREHGFPLRVLLPGKFGMKQPKWLTRIEFVDREYLGYWESQGWSNSAEKQLKALVDDPSDGARLQGESFVVTGYAVAGLDGVKKVEISSDGATWQEAQIFSNPKPSQVWAFWKYVWVKPPRGQHTIRARHGVCGNHTDLSCSLV